MLYLPLHKLLKVRRKQITVLTFICHLSCVVTLALKGLEPNTFMKHSFYNKYAINTMYAFHTNVCCLKSGNHYVVRKSEGLFLTTQMCTNAPSKMRSTPSERDGYYVHFCLQWKSSKTS